MLMSTTQGSLHRLSALWLASIVTPAVAQFLLSWAWPDAGVLESPNVLFGLVVIGASGCAIVSLMVLARADRTNESELGYLGLFFFAMSVLPLVHGIATPGVLYGPNDAAMSSAFWAIPVALGVGAPALLPRRFSSKLDSHWRSWISFGRTVTVIVAASLLIWTSLLPTPDPGALWTAGVAVLSFSGCVALSLRHLMLARVARSPAPLLVAAGYGFVGSSAFVWIGATPFSTGFWVAHLLDIGGVFLGVAGALVAYRKTGSVRDVLQPILVADPRSALELGLEPVVHSFVRDLEEKDVITRDHVLRTTELAMLAGDRMGLGAEELRTLGLSALLHDVGKLEIPDAVLNKPDRLTDLEYTMIKRHPDYGANMVEATETLSAIAPTIRSHHERMDGGGYPRGLVGSQIPLHARIVAVCDAYDAMANTRQYRSGMGSSRAIEILEQNAGTQWDARVVDCVVRIVRARPPATSPTHLAAVGQIGCDCVPAEFAEAA